MKRGQIGVSAVAIPSCSYRIAAGARIRRPPIARRYNAEATAPELTPRRDGSGLDPSATADFSSIAASVSGIVQSRPSNTTKRGRARS